MDIGIISIIGITIAAVTTVVGVVWKLSGWKHKVDGELDKMDGKLDKVNGKLDDLEPLRKNAGLLASMITEIHKAVNEKFGRTLFSSKSPISLTEFGEKLARKIHAHQLVDKYADELQGKLESKNAYEIQEACFDFSENDLLDKLKTGDKDNYSRITDSAFQDGIEINEVMRVVGILLRDRVLDNFHIKHSDLGKPLFPPDE